MAGKGVRQQSACRAAPARPLVCGQGSSTELPECAPWQDGWVIRGVSVPLPIEVCGPALASIVALAGRGGPPPGTRGAAGPGEALSPAEC